MLRNERRPGARKKENLLRREGVVEVDWKDTALLRKFLSDRGKIRSRRVTGLTPQEQRDVAKAIKNAREMALLPHRSSHR
ncbi:30S ribosomal protein S18 [Parasphingorhabdus pacifica]